jgi:hypothetical protein
LASIFLFVRFALERTAFLLSLSLETNLLGFPGELGELKLSLSLEEILASLTD